MKKNKRQQLKAALSQMLQANECFAIHEPSLAALSGLLTLGPRVDECAVAAAIGVSAGESPTVQMAGNVAVIPVFGVLRPQATWLTQALGWTSTEQLTRDVQDAAAKADVKAIVLLVDSPGGSTLGVEEAAQAIFNARGSKPIYAFVRGMGASAAYWIAAAAHEVYAQPSSIVGSIGAVSTHIEYAKALADDGIGVSVIRSAPLKQLWNPYEKLDGNARATLQKLVGDVGAQFEAAVARQRGVSQADVKSKFGQGDAFLAAEAHKRGLIDGVISWDQMLAKAQAASPDKVTVAGAQMRSVATFSTADSTLSADWSASLQSAYDAAHPLLINSQASGFSAAVSAALVPLPPAQLPTTAAEVSTPMKVSARVRAALFARGLIDAQDADNGLCVAILNTYYAASGSQIPTADEADAKACDARDAKIIVALMAAPIGARENARDSNASVNQPATGAAANVQQAHDREMLEAQQQGGLGERNRIKAIQASGKLLNMTAEAIQAGIDGGKTHAEVIEAWHVELGARNKPVTAPAGGDGPRVTGDGAEAFQADATLALQVRLGRVSAKEEAKVSDNVKRLSRAPLAYFAQQCLASHNVRMPEFLQAEELFEAAFAMDGHNHVTVSADYAPFSRPGSFPNLLSNLANKVLDYALELSEPTYEEWTGVWPGDLPDFKPAPIVNKGQHDEMDEVLDAEASKEFGLDEEVLGAMLLRRFSNFFALTPVMAANDDLSAFDEGLLGLEMAWQNTVNRGCVRQLTGNVTLLDTYALYDNTNHGNDITSGAAPSDAQWDAMQLKVAAQTGVGGKGYIRTPLRVALVPPALWRSATQAFSFFQIIGENKVATSDTNVNVYRGAVTVVKEPELHGDSDAKWYGFAKPQGMRNASIIRAYFRGWGRDGRRQRWYDPKTKCWNFELEGRVGIAPKQYRLTVRNAGA
jgi:signal peptide peptidase SppA